MLPINKSVLVSLLLAVLAVRPVLSGELNPFDDDPVDDGSGTGTTTGGTGTGGTTTGGSGGGPTPTPKVYSCPADNGAKYTTGGITFELKCNHGTKAKSLGVVNNIDSQAACADNCAAEPRCQSCDWNSGSQTCNRFSEYIPTIPWANVNTWFPITKRPDPNEDPNFHTCPQDDGKTFTTADGTFFRVNCEVHGIAANTPDTSTIKKLTTETFADCMEACSKEAGCISVDYSARPGDHPDKECILFRTGGGDTPTTSCARKSVDTAYAIDPPEEDHPDEGTIMCSTECPFANGQVFDSSAGERFHIDCGRRHGTKVIFQDSQDSLKDCMEACGKLLACHSVDYQVSKKLCYYGQHHGEPQNLTPGWASAHSIGCAGACSSKGCCGQAAAPPPAPKVEAKCPEANGKVFEKGGKKYKLWCGLINHGANDLTITTEKDWDACIEKCNNTDKCVRAIYHPKSEGGSDACYLRTHGNLETPVTSGEGYQSAHLCTDC